MLNIDLSLCVREASYRIAKCFIKENPFENIKTILIEHLVIEKTIKLHLKKNKKTPMYYLSAYKDVE